MDEDIYYGLLFLLAMFALVSFAMLVPFTCVAIPVCLKTRKWQKEKARRADQPDDNVEMNPLVDDENEDDYDLDSEEEAELQVQKELDEAQNDWDLTTWQKFKKELGRAWNGPSQKEAEAKKAKEEREERQKIAKAVAREVARLERRQRRAQQASSSSTEVTDDSLPSYKNAVGGDRKV